MKIEPLVEEEQRDVTVKIEDWSGVESTMDHSRQMNDHFEPEPSQRVVNLSQLLVDVADPGDCIIDAEYVKLEQGESQSSESSPTDLSPCHSSSTGGADTADGGAGVVVEEWQQESLQIRTRYREPVVEEEVLSRDMLVAPTTPQMGSLEAPPNRAIVERPPTPPALIGADNIATIQRMKIWSTSTVIRRTGETETISTTMSMFHPIPADPEPNYQPAPPSPPALCFPTQERLPGFSSLLGSLTVPSPPNRTPLFTVKAFPYLTKGHFEPGYLGAPIILDPPDVVEPPAPVVTVNLNQLNDSFSEQYPAKNILTLNYPQHASRPPLAALVDRPLLSLMRNPVKRNCRSSFTTSNMGATSCPSLAALVDRPLLSFMRTPAKESFKSSSTTSGMVPTPRPTGILQPLPPSLANIPEQVDYVLQQEHSSFFSLLRDVICALPQQRVSLLMLHKVITKWTMTADARKNEWFYCVSDWTFLQLLFQALYFLSGHYSAFQPEGFTPFCVEQSQQKMYQWIAHGRDDDTILTSACNHWLEICDQLPPPDIWGELEKCQGNEDEQQEAAEWEQQRNPEPPIHYWVDGGNVRSTHKKEKGFRQQERRRFSHPNRGFTYCINGEEYVVGPVKGVYSPEAGGKSREHQFLVKSRPSCVTLLALVRDAVARLPDGQGTRVDVCNLLRDSGYLQPLDKKRVGLLHNAVIWALDKLNGEKDSSVKYDSGIRKWIYLHKNRSLVQWERRHLHLGQRSTPQATVTSESQMEQENRVVMEAEIGGRENIEYNNNMNAEEMEDEAGQNQMEEVSDEIPVGNLMEEEVHENGMRENVSSNNASPDDASSTSDDQQPQYVPPECPIFDEDNIYHPTTATEHVLRVMYARTESGERVILSATPETMESIPISNHPVRLEFEPAAYVLGEQGTRYLRVPINMPTSRISRVAPITLRAPANSRGKTASQPTSVSRFIMQDAKVAFIVEGINGEPVKIVPVRPLVMQRLFQELSLFGEMPASGISPKFRIQERPLGPEGVCKIANPNHAASLPCFLYRMMM